MEKIIAELLTNKDSRNVEKAAKKAASSAPEAFNPWN